MHQTEALAGGGDYDALAKRYVGLIFAGLVVATTVFIALSPPRVLVGYLIPDDAFYYLRVAQNIAGGWGSTFDQINKTNGYHPLWLLVVLPIYMISNDPVIALRLVLVCNGILWLIAMRLLWKCVAARNGLAASVWGSSLLVAVVAQPFWGMESALACALLLAFVDYWKRNAPIGRFPMNWKNPVIAGIWLGLASLARLELAIAVPCIIGILWLTSYERFSQRLKASILFGAPATLMIGCYLVINIILFGHPLPISGFSKLDPGALITSLRVPSQTPSYTLMLLAIVSLAYLTWWMIIGLSKKGGGSQCLAGLSCFVIIHLLLIVLIITHFGTWTYAPDLAVASVVGAELLGTIRQKLRALVPRKGALVYDVLIVVIASITLARPVVTLSNGQRLVKEQIDLLEAGQWARENIAADRPILMSDAGIFSYFSQRKVVNADGLINSYQYLDYVRTGKFLEFVAENGIAMIAAYLPRNGPTTTSSDWVYIPRTVAEIGGNEGILLSRDDEIYRNPSVAIWKVTSTVRTP